MKLRLPIIIIFLLSYYLLLITNSCVLAQDISPAASLNQQPIDTYGNLLEDFIRKIKGLPEELEQINKSALPLDVGQSIEDPEVIETEGQSNIEVDTNTGQKAAHQYALGSSRTDPTDQISTDANTFLGKLISLFLDILGVGDDKAQNYAGSNLPLDVAYSNLASNYSLLQVLETDEESSVLGISDEKINMENALDVSRCSNLPFGLCDESNNLRQTNLDDISLPTGSPQLPTQTPGKGEKLYYDIPYFQNSQYIDEINSLLPRLRTNMPRLAKAVKDRGWYDTLVVEFWQVVFDRSLSQGWNPAFSLAIWIEETAASAVCKVANNRYNDPVAIASFGIYDFGVLSKPRTYCKDTKEQKVNNLMRQLDLFLELNSYYKKLQKTSELSFEQFLCMYSEGHFPCTFDKNPGFLKRLPQVYDCLVSENPSSTTCPSGYFRF